MRTVVDAELAVVADEPGRLDRRRALDDGARAHARNSRVGATWPTCKDRTRKCRVAVRSRAGVDYWPGYLR